MIYKLNTTTAERLKYQYVYVHRVYSIPIDCIQNTDTRILCDNVYRSTVMCGTCYKQFTLHIAESNDICVFVCAVSSKQMFRKIHETVARFVVTSFPCNVFVEIDIYLYTNCKFVCRYS